ncbi:asparagine synthase (glutamine-hydrolyzing) [Chromobacterium vaccinii]|uniref:asparagine synthase (glutamine-hydrolyzing) n=1 Tax=Chromobacterium vaccinii TaxID=1108595 RepID=UPI001E5BCD90|nr:asparagine synthase (glutamine-hydrolyzing) [Chromobacterium vaccinii]MCD4483868.1 asparagine synthase (glutamine-hydrolyzing) [Chromobacterium vaccinii]
MCGYVGIFSAVPREFSPNIFDQALQSIYHRGPDSNNTWFDPKGHVAFGYVRLGLVGLSNGTQPIVADQGDLVLMVNGELYDYQRIRAELEGEGCRFKTSSDSEIAMHLYRLYGMNGLKRLRGEFSIMLYDRQRNLLVAMRDRLGVKPLYYAQYNGAWYFGSEVKAILAAGVPAEWDYESYASRAFVLRDGTLFKHIRSVQPGTWMIIDGSGVQRERYWDFDYLPKNHTLDLNEEEMIESVREAIEESLTLRLHADVPIGVCLSGGLDSSAMLGLATQLTGQKLNAFHLSFGGDDGYDESKYAEIVAKYNEATLHTVKVSQDDLADNFESTLWHTEIPFSNAHSIAKYVLCRFVQQSGYRAVITGEGADEVFGGYPHFRRDMVLYNNEHQDQAIINQLRSQIKGAGGRYLDGAEDNTSWVTEQLGHGVSWLETQAALFNPLGELYTEEFRSLFNKIDPYRQFFDRLNPTALEGRDPMHRSMYMVAKSSLPNLVLTTLGDRMEMAGSLEGRPPLLDHKVVELACKLPVWMKVRGITEKYVLREAMRPYLPGAIYERKKQYFRAPPAVLRKDGRLYQLVSDLINGEAISKLPFFDPNKVRKLLTDAPNMAPAQQASADHLLMEVASLCLLQSRFSIS